MCLCADPWLQKVGLVYKGRSEDVQSRLLGVRAGDYGLRKLMMLNVSNGNLIELEWQIHVISNIKFTAISSKTYPNSLLYIQ